MEKPTENKHRDPDPEKLDKTHQDQDPDRIQELLEKLDQDTLTLMKLSRTLAMRPYATRIKLQMETLYNETSSTSERFCTLCRTLPEEEKSHHLQQIQMYKAIMDRLTHTKFSPLEEKKEKIQFLQEVIEQRQKQIAELEKMVHEVTQLFQDVHDLIQSQQEPLNQIENNIADAVQHVEEGHENLKRTETKQSENRAWKAAVVGGVIGFVVTGPIGAVYVAKTTSIGFALVSGLSGALMGAWGAWGTSKTVFKG